ncbi:hypothetical protein J2X63_003202 [Agromyces sp. 3263]|uniref:hypothetical protein n=1 Tax=Agromyces sp. 3263 TaxID=2817750 RepID=UPI0028542827|nr:hypothetical protein [Agromyces sp. 3263]MDR6907494.1 hypothetical protein [Agromyces sp. 3263]
MAYTTVEGTVSRINSRGNGFGLREENEYQGKTRTTYWSVFPPKDAARTVSEGDRIKASGFLGTKVSERDARFVDHTLNQAKVLEGAAPVVSAPAADTWTTPADYSDNTPF